MIYKDLQLERELEMFEAEIEAHLQAIKQETKDGNTTDKRVPMANQSHTRDQSTR